MNELYFETCGSPNWMSFKPAVDQDLNQNSLVTKSKEWVFHQSHKRSNKQQFNEGSMILIPKHLSFPVATNSTTQGRYFLKHHVLHDATLVNSIFQIAP